MTPTNWRRFGLWVTCVLVASTISVTAQAATLVVDCTLDTVDASPGDGVCADADGQCTLRAAVQEANALPGQDLIEVNAGSYFLNRAGPNEDLSDTGDLDLTEDLVITGSGAGLTIVDGSLTGQVTEDMVNDVDRDRVFHVVGGISITLANMTIQGGEVSGNTPNFGAGVYAEGATSLLALNNVEITRNFGIAARGGGVYAAGALLVQNSTIHNNKLADEDGNTSQIDGGGGIYALGATSIRDSVIHHNFIDNDDYYNGAGVYFAASGSSLVIQDSQISYNVASGQGGGIYINANNALVTLTGTLVGGEVHPELADPARNLSKSGAAGGGVYIIGDNVAFSADNSKFNNNFADYDDQGPGYGGAFFLGGSNNKLNLKNCEVNDNMAAERAAAIYVSGSGNTVDLEDTDVRGNIVEDDEGGGIYGESGTLNWDGGSLDGNRSDDGPGGGIIWEAGSINLSNLSVMRNHGYGGGGIYLPTADVVLTANACLFAYNKGDDDYGGAIYNIGSNLTITNSTFSSNHGWNGGGAIYTEGGGVTLDHVTLAENRGETDRVTRGAALHVAGGTMTVSNTIIQTSPIAEGDNCFVDVGGALVSAGRNIEDVNTCNLSDPTDLVNTDSLIGPLKDNDGPTMTHALLAGSPAIDAGTPLCVGRPTDQRGVRGEDGDGDLIEDCDVGAYEYDGPPVLDDPPPTPPVGFDYYVDSELDAVDANPGDGICASAVGECTLRAAVMEANATPGPESIYMPPGTFELTLTNFYDDINQETVPEDLGLTGDLDVTEELTIEGAGEGLTIIDAEKLMVEQGRTSFDNPNPPVGLPDNDIMGDRAFDLLGAFGFTMRDLTITNASHGDDFGVFEIYNGMGVHAPQATSLTFERVTFDHNRMDFGYGGGFYSAADGAVLMITDCTFQDNKAGEDDGNDGGGGGFYSAGVGTTITITQSNFYGNYSSLDGAGFYIAGDNSTVTLVDVVIGAEHEAEYSETFQVLAADYRRQRVTRTSNMAVGYSNDSGGGAGYIAGSNVQMDITDSTIRGNVVEGSGGAFHVSGDNFSLTMAGTILDGNKAEANSGGAIYVSGLNPTLVITGSSVSNNTADDGGSGGAFALENGGSLDISGTPVDENHSGDLGGALFALGATLSLSEVSLNDNRSEYHGGAVYVDGGLLSMDDSIMNRNRAEDNSGGAMYIEHSGVGGSANVVITDVTMDGNVGEGGGGAIYNNDDGAALAGVPVTLDRVTISNSTPDPLGVFPYDVWIWDYPDDGGAIYNNGPMTITNSTLSGNEVENAGGAIYNDFGGTLTLDHVTISDNGSVYDIFSPIRAYNPGGALYNDGTLTMSNTLLADNKGDTCDMPVPLSSQGYNLDDQAANTCGLGVAGDLIGVDARLSPLGNYGGGSFTHNLEPGSAAIDTADPACMLLTDQRGQTRPEDGDNDTSAVCDIGAVEYTDDPSGLATEGPEIVSTPPDAGHVVQAYTYNAVSTNPAGFAQDCSPPAGPLSWSVTSAPDPSVTINSITGRLTWPAPTLGMHSFTIEVLDANGLTDEQTWTVEFFSGPEITSSPLLEGSSTEVYSYNATATDPAGGGLTWSILTDPSGGDATIDPFLGVLTWPNPVSGAQEFTIETRDVFDRTDTQTWTVVIADGPVITTTPITEVASGSSYSYDADATDSAGGGLVWVLDLDPSDGDIVINGNTGEITWANPPDGDHLIGIIVVDVNNRFDTQTWVLSVVDQGPDDGGYTWSGVTCNFDDLTGIDTEVILGDDDVSNPLSIGFTFGFYNINYNQFYIASNGLIIFEPLEVEDGCCEGQDLPDPNSPNGLIAGMWEDLNPEAGGRISYATLGVAPNRRLVVEFDGIFNFTPSTPNSFQIVLFEGSNAFEIRHASTADNSDGSVATVGFESALGAINAGETTGLNIRHGEFGNITDTCWQAGQPGSGFAISANGPYTVSENGTQTLTGVCSDGNCDTYAWDLDNSGTFETPGQQVVFSALGIDGDAPPLTVRVEGCNTTTLECVTDTTTITVLNVPPTIVSLPPTDGEVGVTYLYQAQAVDPAGAADPLTWSLLVAPVGMAVDPGTGLVSWPNPVDGIHPVTLTVADGDGGSDVQSWEVFILDQGPDDGDYTWAPVVCDLTDISVTGTNVWIPGTEPDDALSPSIPIGFTFNYYGIDYTDVHVCPNGYISFDAGAACDFGDDTPYTIVSPDGNDNMIAGFWEDLSPNVAGQVQYATAGLLPNRQFTVQFTGVPHFENSSAVVSFQIVLYEGSNEFDINLIDTDADTNEDINDYNVSINTLIGFEDSTASTGLLIRESGNTEPFAGLCWRGGPPSNAPVVDAGGPYVVNEGGVINLGADCVSGTCVSWEWDLDCDGVAFNSIDAINILTTFAGEDGDDTCTVQVRGCNGDAECGEDSALVTINNMPPAITSSPPLTVAPLIDYSYDPVGVDPAGVLDPLSWALLQSPAGMNIDSITGAITWKPTCLQAGIHTVEIEVSDDDGATATQQWILLVADEDSDGDGAFNCLDNCPEVANTTVRNITVDGDINDFGDPEGTDTRPGPPVDTVAYYFSIDPTSFHIGWTGPRVQDPGDSIHIAIRVPQDGITSQTHEGMNFPVGLEWTYMISFYGQNNICYYAFDNPTVCQPKGADWAHFAGFELNPTSEISVPRNFLGSLAGGAGNVEIGVYGVNVAADFVWTTFPNSNDVGIANRTWGNYADLNYPTVLSQDDFDNDGIGDACDDDSDNDGLVNAIDNCDTIVNWSAPDAFQLQGTTTLEFDGAAVVVLNGEVYLFGSDTGGTDAARYDPATGVITALAQIPAPGVSGARAIVDADDNIHIFGGVDPSTGLLTNTHLIYDTAANSYTAPNDLPAELQRNWTGGTMPLSGPEAVFVGGWDPSDDTLVTTTGYYDLLEGVYTNTATLTTSDQLGVEPLPATDPSSTNTIAIIDQPAAVSGSLEAITLHLGDGGAADGDGDGWEVRVYSLTAGNALTLESKRALSTVDHNERDPQTLAIAPPLPIFVGQYAALINTDGRARLTRDAAAPRSYWSLDVQPNPAIGSVVAFDDNVGDPGFSVTLRVASEAPDRSFSQKGEDEVVYLSNTPGQALRFNAGNGQWLDPIPVSDLNYDAPMFAGIDGMSVLFGLGEDVDTGAPLNLFGVSVQSYQAFDTGVAWPNGEPADGLVAVGDTRLVAWQTDVAGTSFFTADVVVSQTDLDLDGLGDACDDDRDGDGVVNPVDNCPDIVNPGQEDADMNNIGDICEPTGAPPQIVNLLPDMDSYAVSVDLTFSVQDDCPWPPRVLAPLGVSRLGMTDLGGGQMLTDFSIPISTPGVTNQNIQIESRCDALQDFATVILAVDPDPPIVNYSIPGLDQAGVVIGQEPTYPIILTTDVISFDTVAPILFDPISGLVLAEVVVDGSIVIDRDTFIPSGNPERGELAPHILDCDSAEPGLCIDSTTLAVGALGEGAHCLEITGEDAAGNTTTATFCFKVTEDIDLTAGLNDLCERYRDEIDSDYPAADPGPLAQLARDEGILGHNLCGKAISCVERDDEYFHGCVEQGLEGAHKSLINIERDFPGAHLQLRLELAEFAINIAALASIRAAINPAPDTQVSLAQGEAALLLAQGELTAQATTEAIIQAHEAYFWFSDAKGPFGAEVPSYDTGCATANRLIILMQEYEEVVPTIFGANDVRAAKQDLEEIRALLKCNPGGANLEDQACFDVSVLTAMNRMADLSSELNGYRLDRTDNKFMVWTRNWRYAIARLVQARINRALFNLDSWVALGLVFPEYDPVFIADTNAGWDDAEEQLSDVGNGNLDIFLGAFTSTEAKCTIHYMYEMVIDWWLDAANPDCAPLVPYVLPAACLDENNINQWPIHGGTVVTE